MKKPSDKESAALEHEKKPMKKWLRVLLIVVAIILALCIAATATVYIMYNTGKRGMLNNSDIVISAPEINDQEIEIDDSGKTILYQGKKYTYNDNITSVLFIGVDKNDVDVTFDTIGKNGQADALYLAVIDTTTGKISLLSISRDTITDISVYSQTGVYVGIEKLPICAAYAYGDGRATSCENTVTAVSRLLYGIPINRYIALDMNAISTVTSFTGGVEVPEFNSSFTAETGRKTTVSGASALKYVRYRDKTVTGSNDSRLVRQRYFLKSLGSKIMQSIRKDIGYPLKIYNILKPDIVTDISASDVTFLAGVAVKGSGEPVYRSVEGELIEGESYDELYVDNERLYKLVLELFYIEQ